MGSLRLSTQFRNGRTETDSVDFTAPLKFAKPFYREGVTEFMYMCAGPGLLDGDSLNMTYEIGKDCSAMVTGQSYTKIFKSEREGASMSVSVNVGENASLFYCPAPTIPFAGSRYKANSVVGLTRSSRLLLCDAVSCGRVGMGERFEFDSFNSRISVYVDGELVFLDNTRLVPEEVRPDGIGFFEGHTHLGLIYAYGFDIAIPPQVSDAEAAITNAAAGVVVRILADSGDAITRLARQILSQCTT
ncbi:MAG: urease accessory protein UreD [Oscillospiraceae bacterium]|nr:urease accessory protein UreD [Oscillospiraceae bacterium]